MFIFEFSTFRFLILILTKNSCIFLKIIYIEINYKMNINLIDLILQKLSFYDQVRLHTLTSFIFNLAIIKKLEAPYNMRNKHLTAKNCYTDEYLWSGIVELKGNKWIDGFYPMHDTLLILYIDDRETNIQNYHINFLRLTKLSISFCYVIEDLNFMADSLRILNIAYSRACMKQNSIKKLQLIELNTANNTAIYDLNFMAATLRILNVSEYHCSVDQKGIKDLQLIQLTAYGNPRIMTKSF